MPVFHAGSLVTDKWAADTDSRTEGDGAFHADFSFDADGEPTHTPIAQIVQGGKFVPLTVAMQSMATPEATAAATAAS